MIDLILYMCYSEVNYPGNKQKINITFFTSIYFNRYMNKYVKPTVPVE